MLTVWSAPNVGWYLLSAVFLITVSLGVLRTQELSDGMFIKRTPRVYLTANLNSNFQAPHDSTGVVEGHADLEANETEMVQLDTMQADDENGHAVIFGNLTLSSLGTANDTTETSVEEHFNEKQEGCGSSRRKEIPGFTGGSWLQYVHIPKTGGTSIQFALSKLKPVSTGNAVIMLFNGATIRNSSYTCPYHAMEASILMGHRGFGFCAGVEHHPHRKLVTFATLREPVHMIISLFDYTFARGDPRFVGTFGREKLLQDLVKEYYKTPEIEPGERILRGMGRMQSMFMCGYQCLGKDAVDNANMTDQHIMDRAKQNILRTDILGISEELDRVLVQFRFHAPRLHVFTHWPEMNAAHSRKSILDEEALSILSEWSVMDRALYEFAMPVYRRKQALAERCMGHSGRR